MKSPIKPFSVQATEIEIRPVSFGPPPSFFYSLRGANEEILKEGNFSMTVAQWKNWPKTTPDDDYILDCALTNLGLQKP